MPSLATPVDVPTLPSKKALGKRRALPKNPLPQTSFNTLERERRFRHPSKTDPHFAEAHELIKPHIESFNALFEGENGRKGLLELAVKDLEQKVVFSERAGKGNKLVIKVESISVGRPVQPDRAKATEPRIFPSEARERMTTYGGKMTAKISWSVNGGPAHTEHRELGSLPIMVRSIRCNIRNMSPAALVERHEEAEEMGGYFIVNGNERLIRYLIVPRRNHVISIFRNSFQNRGDAYSPYGVQIRCVRPDETAQTNTLHYLTNGSVTIRFSWRKSEYMIPVMMVLKALESATDKDIFAGLVQNDFDPFLTDRIELLLRGFKAYNLYNGKQCREFLGDRFRIVLGCPADWSNEEVGKFLIKKIVLVHLKTAEDKFRLLLFMIRKLYALVGGDCCADNPDSPQHQEILMPGFLFGMIIKEKLDELTGNMRAQIQSDVDRGTATVDFHDNKYLQKAFTKISADVGGKLQFFLATGNLITPTGLDLQQAAGFTIVAEKLNFYRFIAHFRCVHRGAFFMELRTTAVRKLLPDSWGFLCPVHTPDGSPCGLLNHFSHQCKLVTQTIDASSVEPLLASLGMTQPWDSAVEGKKNVCVQLDGKIIGWATPTLAAKMAQDLRVCKTEGKFNIPLDLEIGLVPSSKGGQYPGLYLFSSRSRMMRPVKYLPNMKTDHVGPFEQVYLDIACVPEEVVPGSTTFSHVEHAPTHMLSVLANLTPFSDYNQSPRNMYQCQMGKQTMGTPSTNLPHRTDNKLYRIQSPQTPIVRPALHDTYGFDSFPNGTNAVVAVISYTGYDMEDAMILNKSAHERGFGYGTIYKSVVVDLKDKKGNNKDFIFMLGPDVKAEDEKRTIVDDDGLPFIGSKLKKGQPMAAYYDPTIGRTQWDKYKGDEVAYVEEVRLIGSDTGDAHLTKIHVKLRIPRAPVIGDKFSSRHGQKGVCSQKWPAIDMPFSESGMQPDVIINPHAFPSRMTIGMFVESLAGKAGACHGIPQDATPFTFSETDTPAEYFGEQLKAAGYGYHGNEPMYSGITGKEFAADIFIGLVYYQRLRHMVSDKWQVRTTGQYDQLTRQPIKGRKRGGGIRFGEMERDALLAHGTSFLLQDRLMNCSDYSTAWVCRDCGSMISLGYDEVGLGTQVIAGPDGSEYEPTADLGPGGEYCRVCRHEDEEARKAGKPVHVSLTNGKTVIAKKGRMDLIAVPFVFRYLLAELAAMNIKLQIGLSS